MENIITIYFTDVLTNYIVVMADGVITRGDGGGPSGGLIAAELTVIQVFATQRQEQRNSIFA